VRKGEGIGLWGNRETLFGATLKTKNPCEKKQERKNAKFKKLLGKRIGSSQKKKKKKKNIERRHG